LRLIAKLQIRVNPLFRNTHAPPGQVIQGQESPPLAPGRGRVPHAGHDGELERLQWWFDVADDLLDVVQLVHRRWFLQSLAIVRVRAARSALHNIASVIEVCAPVHDAILICAPLSEFDAQVAAAREATHPRAFKP